MVKGKQHSVVVKGLSLHSGEEKTNSQWVTRKLTKANWPPTRSNDTDTNVVLRATP